MRVFNYQSETSGKNVLNKEVSKSWVSNKNKIDIKIIFRSKFNHRINYLAGSFHYNYPQIRAYP